MDNTSEALIIVRQHRLKRVLASALLARAPILSADTKAEKLSWSMLLDIPDWCHWSSPRIEQLVLTAGALFAAPAMRLWIEAKRIEEAKRVIGKDLFERIIAHQFVPHAVLQFPGDVDLAESLRAVGANVLLNSLHQPCLRNKLAFLLPSPLGVLSSAVAFPLSLEAVALMENLKVKKETS